MRLLDPKFRTNKARYVAQCTLAAMVVFIVLMILHAIASAAVIAALGASSFIAFTMPHRMDCQPRYMLGGYAIGIATGTLFHFIALWTVWENIPVVRDIAPMLFAAVAVGFAIFLMVLLNFEHPPAAGVALGLAIGQCGLLAVTVVAVGIISLVAAKTLMRPWLMDLL